MVILIGCALNEVHWITRDVASGDFVDNFWDTGTVGINVCGGLAKLENGYGK